jgi:peptidoglycan biosynthesis protein MviN/MurJ (putative lipid II flippase)
LALVPLSSIFYLIFLANNQARLLAKLSASLIITNLLLCLFFMQFLGVAGIALGTTVLYVIQISVCGYLGEKGIGNLGMRALVAPISKMLVAALLAGFCLGAGLHVSEGLGISWNDFFSLARLCILGLIGGFVYLVVCSLLRVEEVVNGLKRIRKYRK